jgi:hypothetical protein
MAPQIFSDWRAIPKEARGATVALGNFDGVHLGHVAVLKAAQAARPDLPLAVLTFEPHPREHFRPDDPAFRLTLLPAKAACLADAGARFVYALSFDDEFAALSAEAFVEQVLHKALGAKHLASGPDFAFGNRRGGDVRFLAREAAARGCAHRVGQGRAFRLGVVGKWQRAADARAGECAHLVAAKRGAGNTHIEAVVAFATVATVGKERLAPALPGPRLTF